MATKREHGKAAVEAAIPSGASAEAPKEDRKASPRKQELLELANVLSDYECEHLVRAVKDVAVGERFWEGDVGIFYNEYVKTRVALHLNPGI
jgi:hypothetical protein